MVPIAFASTLDTYSLSLGLLRTTVLPTLSAFSFGTSCFLLEFELINRDVNS